MKIIIQPLTFSEGIRSVCSTCRGIVATGKTMLQVRFPHDKKEYAIKSPERIICCGIEKAVPQLFDSDSDAQTTMLSVITNIQSGKLPELVVIDDTEEKQSFEPKGGW